MNFEWDLTKAELNRKRHRVTFEEARTIFEDALARLKYDPEHSQVEQRLVAIGVSERGRLLVVAYCERGDRIRLISARKPTRRERKSYEDQRS